ncbi:ATP-dependent Clp protease proteolytic subunit [Fervidibacter sacchari]
MPNTPIVIKFFAPIIDVTTNALMDVIDQAMKAGQKSFILLISSPGGNVFYGLSAYNYLKGIPVDITTHNFGSVDSVATLLYCAGKKRLCVPTARFLLHGVSAQFPQPVALEEKQLEERLKSLRIDLQNIARVIASNTGKSQDEVIQAMLDRTTLNPEEAKSWGLVHEIKVELFPPGVKVISIQYQEQPAQR